MVVLDALHWIQAHEAPDLAVRWNCKAAKCGSCSAEVNGRPSLTCKTRLSDFEERDDHGRADAGVPAHPRPRHRRVLELRGQQVDPAVQAAGRPARRRTGAGSRRTSSGSRSSGSASSASCARTSATSCATTRPSSRSWARASSSAPPGLEMHPIDQADRREYLKDERRHRLLQHHEVLHRGLPGAHQDHRQRDHPAQGAGRGRATTTRSSGLAQAPRRRQEGAAPSSSRRSGEPGRRGGAARSGAARREPEPTGADVATRRLWGAGRRARAAASAAGRPRRAIVIRHRRRRPRQPGSALRRARSSSTLRAGRRAPPARAAGRDDLRLPRRPDEQRRRVHGRRPGPRARPRAGRDRGRPAPRLEADRRAARRPLAGKDAKLIPLWEEAADAPRASIAGPRPTCRAPELRRRRAGERGDRPGRGRRPGSVVRRPALTARVGRGGVARGHVAAVSVAGREPTITFRADRVGLATGCNRTSAATRSSAARSRSRGRVERWPRPRRAVGPFTGALTAATTATLAGTRAGCSRGAGRRDRHRPRLERPAFMTGSRGIPCRARPVHATHSAAAKRSDGPSTGKLWYPSSGSQLSWPSWPIGSASAPHG